MEVIHVSPTSLLLSRIQAHEQSSIVILLIKLLRTQYGVWKRRFPVLSKSLRCHLQNMSNIIVATSVLHNNAIAPRENLPPEDPEVNLILQLIHQQDEIPLQGNQQVPAVHLNYGDEMMMIILDKLLEGL
ncbi:hypothetical protein ANN_27782 [Periplaneta americana]|uniref:DDE Tnp4 domain-containing protein n=1 Tax=Periplaneta americana TaxID=6978 RepID=A0ABQ8RV93_PERAM|nr:hypothetical protein ANN_27782 [Periplaneta americana]